jgi:hypothetical protein
MNNPYIEKRLRKLLKMMRAHFANEHPDPDQTLPCKYLDDIEEEITKLITQRELQSRRNEVGLIDMGDPEYPSKRLADLTSQLNSLQGE